MPDSLRPHRMAVPQTRRPQLPSPNSFNHSRLCNMPCKTSRNSRTRRKRRTPTTIGWCTICIKNFVLCPLDKTRHIAELFAALYTGCAHRPPRHSAKTSTHKRSSATADAAAFPAARRKRMEQLEPNNICTYWPANPDSIASGRCTATCSLSTRTEICFCQFLPRSRISTTGGIWVSTERRRAQDHNRQRWAHPRAGRGPTQAARRHARREPCWWQWVHARCLPTLRDDELQDGKTIFRLSVHFTEASRHWLSLANIQRCATAIGRWRSSYAIRVVVCDDGLNFIDVCLTVA